MAQLKKILLVDDDDAFREALGEQLLMTEDFDVFEAGSGADALAKTKAGRMEVNTMSAPFAPGGRTGGMFSGSRGGARGGRHNSASGLSRDRPGSDIFIAPSTRRLDDTDHDPDAFHAGTSKSERLRRRVIGA